MNPIPLVPRFRIEISAKGSPSAKAPEAWFVADLAHTDLQAKAMIPRWEREEGISVRVVPNRQPIGAEYHPGAEVVKKSLQGRGFAEVTDTRPIPPGVTEEAPASVAAARVAPDSAKLAEPVEEIEAQIDFEVGDRLLDTLAPDHPALFVTELRKTGPKPGFFWQMPEHKNPRDQKGFCPLESMKYFKPYSAKAAKAAAGDGKGVRTPPGAAAADTPAAPATGKAKRSRARKAKAPHAAAAHPKPHAPAAAHGKAKRSHKPGHA